MASKLIRILCTIWDNFCLPWRPGWRAFHSEVETTRHLWPEQGPHFHDCYSWWGRTLRHGRCTATWSCAHERESGVDYDLVDQQETQDKWTKNKINHNRKDKIIAKINQYNTQCNKTFTRGLTSTSQNMLLVWLSKMIHTCATLGNHKMSSTYMFYLNRTLETACFCWYHAGDEVKLSSTELG